MAAQSSVIMAKMEVEDLMVREFEDAERLIETLTKEVKAKSKLHAEANRRAAVEAKRAAVEAKLRAEADKRAEESDKRAEESDKRAEELEQALIKLRRELMDKN